MDAVMISNPRTALKRYKLDDGTFGVFIIHNLIIYNVTNYWNKITYDAFGFYILYGDF